MATVTLRDLYAAELLELIQAEQQILNGLPGMASRATSIRLRRLFDEHQSDTRVQLDRLRLLVEQLNDPPRATNRGAVAALIEDAFRSFDDTERGEILDAALIAAAQRIEHYEIASYGTARSHAYSLGDDDAARLLQQSLDEEGHMDHALTRLAERGINQAAGDDLVEAPTRYRSRLRYVGARDLPGVAERETHLHSRDGEHLGTLDGFVVDSASGRPIYYVIDSRGWFAGRRYVVPVGQIDASDGENTLHTTLSRAELARYPEFSPSAFTAMEDTDVLRYERRLHRLFAPDIAPYDGRPTYDNLPVYRAPSWLMTGVWMSDPPTSTRYGRIRTALPDLPPASQVPTSPEDVMPESERERMIAGEHEPSEPPTTSEPPRIERYRER